MTTSHLPGPSLFCKNSVFASTSYEFLYASSINILILDFKLSVIELPQNYFSSIIFRWLKILCLIVLFEIIKGLEQSIGLKM
jgi:hypothetical protein